MPDSSFRFEDFVLDAEIRELHRAGHPVPLEPQVFDLLLHLCRNSNQVVSREDLIQHVWNGREVSDAAISTRINAARTALGDTGKSQRLIRTITRRGFRFVGTPERQNTATGNQPSNIRYCRSGDGTHLAWESTGTGPPLLKAPNFLSHLELEHHSPVWSHWIRELSRDNTLIRFDQRGNGLSDRDVSDLSLDAYVDDLRHIADNAGVKRFPLIGLSQGAPIAVEFAHRFPERVTGLILVGGYPAGWRKMGDPDLQQRRDAMIQLIQVGWGGTNPAFRQLYTSMFVPDGTPEQQEWFNEMQRATATPEMAARLLASFAEIDVRAHLPHLTVPVLVVHCRNDAIVPFEAGRAFATQIPNARLVALEGNNHVLLESDTDWPIFLDEIRSFLAEINQ